MTKRQPEDRWDDRTEELYTAFKVSPDFKRLRAQALRLLGRRKPLTPEQYSEWVLNSKRPEGYRDFYDECRVVGERYGLAPWTVLAGCILRDFEPRAVPLTWEATWPQARVVTKVDVSSAFSAWLHLEAWKLGLRVIHKNQGPEITVVAPLFRPDHELRDEERPPLASAFFLRAETPLTYPPEAAAELHRRLQRSGRELARQLGYKIPQRLRRSLLVEHADKLRLDKARLKNRETGDIVWDIFGDPADEEQAAVEAPAQADQPASPSLCRAVKNMRHKAKSRFGR